MTSKFMGMVVDNTCGKIQGFENEIRVGIANGEMPEELNDIFKFELVTMNDGEVRAIIDWA